MTQESSKLPPISRADAHVLATSLKEWVLNVVEGLGLRVEGLAHPRERRWDTQSVQG